MFNLTVDKIKEIFVDKKLFKNFYLPNCDDQELIKLFPIESTNTTIKKLHVYVNYDVDYNLLKSFFDISTKVIIKNYSGYNLPNHDNIKLYTRLKDIGSVPLNSKFMVDTDNNEIVIHHINSGIAKNVIIDRTISIDEIGFDKININKLSYLKCRLDSKNVEYLLEQCVLHNTKINYSFSISYYGFLEIGESLINYKNMKLFGSNIKKLKIILNRNVIHPDWLEEYLKSLDHKLKLYIINYNNDISYLFPSIENNPNIILSEKCNFLHDLVKERIQQNIESRFKKTKAIMY